MKTQLVPVEPTEDMMYALTGSDDWRLASRLWQAALAAAPTPPEKDYYLLTAGWLDGHVFIGTPEEARKNPRAVPVYTAHKKNSDPTPPAQEDEPVAYIWEETRSEETNEPYERKLSFRPPDTTGYITQLLNSQWGKVTPLYTRPDGLRKAAEEVVRIANMEGVDEDVVQWMEQLESSIVNLRSALEGK